MKLFTLGPVEIYPEVLSVYNNSFVHFRTDEYSDIVKNCLQSVSKLIGNSTKDSMIYLTASGTAAMEATIENCILENDKILVINGGTFGKRFCQLLNWHKIPFSSIDLKWNETLTYKHLDNFDKEGYTVLFVNLHETSTGQLYNIEILSDFCKRNNMLLIVDAISTFLADDYNMDASNIDVTIISSQKGLCLSPGMSMVSFSDRMLNRIYKNSKSASAYFDFKDYIDNIKRGQTPYTPAVHIMYQLQSMLELIKNSGGKQVWIHTIKEKCDYFRDQVISKNLKIPNYSLSNMLTPLIFEDINAYELIQVLKNKYRIFVNPCGGELANRLLRVSHIGNTSLEDIDDLVKKLLFCIEELKGAI